MATKYTYKVKVTHYVTFMDEDLLLENEMDDVESITDADRAQFAQHNWGGSYETDFETVSAEEDDTEEVDD